MEKEKIKEIVTDGAYVFVPIKELSLERQQRILECRNDQLTKYWSIVGAVDIEYAGTYFDGGSSELWMHDAARAFKKVYTLNKQLATPGNNKSPNWGKIVAAPYDLATRFECEEISLEELKEVLDILDCHTRMCKGVFDEFRREYEKRGGEWL